MNQRYLNSPSVGRAIPAEEFAAGACLRPQPCSASMQGCGSPDCTADGCGQGQEYCQQMVCCCRPVPMPPPEPPQVDEGCCCKQSFHAALNLLCDPQISSLLDFDASAFLTDTYVAGSTLTCRKHSARGSGAEAEVEAEGQHRPPCQSCSSRASDNLGNLEGSFRRFAPCNRDLLDIEAELHTERGKSCGFTATQVSLCELDAVVIQGAAACAEGDMTADEAAARNFRCLRTRLEQRLNPCGTPCGQDQCSCACDERECCCAAGLLDTLSRNNLSRRVSLVAGLLVLTEVTLLGSVGNVLVLSNDADNRLYFVCVNSVQFVG